MFGDGAGLFALALVVFEPNMIAHGAYVTKDMGISCFIFASIYCPIPLHKGAFGWQADRPRSGHWTRSGVETLRYTSPPIRPGTHYYRDIVVLARDANQQRESCIAPDWRPSGCVGHCHRGALGFLWFSLRRTARWNAVESSWVRGSLR
jgi:hypothetical protein